ncbi:MAG: hypothetical protein HZC55_01445 [Verrucomicrobia bacterium]|nr:hypothetical protein [Verrucomicrobiota bacterium]
MNLSRFIAPAFALAVTAQATTITYNDFNSTAGLTLNGNAARVGDVLRLTPATTGQSGSAFSTSTVNLSNNASFSTRFQFQITQNGSFGDGDGAGADGLAFLVQNVANNVGGGGGGIGYQGLSPSLAIEFDTYNNGGGDANNGNHVGINLNGNMSSVALIGVAPRFNNGAEWTVWVDYNGGTQLLEVRWDSTGSATRPVAAGLAYSGLNLSSVLGSTNAYVGFTSGTGSGYGNHDILNWHLQDDYAPITGVPEATHTLPLFILGVLGLIGAARRGSGRR